MIRLFVEGDADVRFFQDYLKELYGIPFDQEVVVKCGGWEKIKGKAGEALVNAMQKNTDKLRIIIFRLANRLILNRTFMNLKAVLKIRTMFNN